MINEGSMFEIGPVGNLRGSDGVAKDFADIEGEENNRQRRARVFCDLGGEERYSVCVRGLLCPALL